MTLETVPVLSIAGMAVAMLVSFALPIALFIYSKKKLHAKTAAFSSSWSSCLRALRITSFLAPPGR